ncbi:MAG: SAM-dependent methyltransferase, partial [Bacteroidota bacterium]
NLDCIFEQATKVLLTGGLVYIGELHPFKQYSGSKARFENEEGMQVVECYTHHVSEFVEAAKNNGFALMELQEHFDDESTFLPRILALLLKKI